MVRAIADAFQIPGVALYDRHTQEVYWGGAEDRPELRAKLEEVARHGRSFQEGTTTVTAIRLGGAPTSSLGIVGVTLNDTVLQSVSNLVAIALERARGQAANARAQAAQESSELRATVSGRSGPRVQDAAHLDESGGHRSCQHDRRDRPATRTGEIINEDLERFKRW